MHNFSKIGRETRRQRSEGGFSLLELTMATGVVLVAVVFMAQTLTTLHRGRSLAECRAVSATVASSIMDELSRGSRADLIAYLPPDFDDLPYDVVVTIQYVMADGTTKVSPPLAANTVLPSPMQAIVQVELFTGTTKLYTYRAATIVSA